MDFALLVFAAAGIMVSIVAKCAYERAWRKSPSFVSGSRPEAETGKWPLRRYAAVDTAASWPHMSQR